jgi:hypothetical protein
MEITAGLEISHFFCPSLFLNHRWGRTILRKGFESLFIGILNPLYKNLF